jgi:hypothetical protein
MSRNKKNTVVLKLIFLGILAAFRIITYVRLDIPLFPRRFPDHHLNDLEGVHVGLATKQFVSDNEHLTRHSYQKEVIPTYGPMER